MVGPASRTSIGFGVPIRRRARGARRRAGLLVFLLERAGHAPAVLQPLGLLARQLPRRRRRPLVIEVRAAHDAVPDRGFDRGRLVAFEQLPHGALVPGGPGAVVLLTLRLLRHRLVEARRRRSEARAWIGLGDERAQDADLVALELPEIARPQPFDVDAGEGEAGEPHQPQADRLAHPLDLLVPRLEQGQRQPDVLRVFIDLGHARGLDHPAVELHALVPPLEQRLGHGRLHLHAVDAGNGAAGMEQAVGQLAVGGEEQGARGVVLQAAHGEDAPVHGVHQIEHGAAALGIGHRRHDAARLVEHVGGERREVEPFPVDLDAIVLGIGLGAELVHHAAVDPHAPADDQLLGMAARGDTGAGDQFL
jgi:hypothetical protein